MRRAVIAVLALALFAPAAMAATKGRTFLPNPSGRTKLTEKRAQRLARKAIRQAYEVRAGTDIYACDRIAANAAECDFAFLSKAEKYTCGVARLSANTARIAVRYAAETGRCPSA